MKSVVDVLSRHVSPRRLSRFHAALRGRVQDTVLVFENVGDPHNAAACLRTADAMGVQDVHIIERWNERFFPCSSTASGAAKWLTLHRHPSSKSCFEALRSEGFAICATDLGAGAVSIEQAVASCVKPLSDCMSSVGASTEMRTRSGAFRRRVALCFGNEHRGLSSAVLAHADVRYFIPMMGFVQSLNVSVAVGVSTAAFLHRTPDFAQHSERCHRFLHYSDQNPPDSVDSVISGSTLSRHDTEFAASEVELATAPDHFVCEMLSSSRRQEVLACWLQSEVRGAEVLLMRAGVRSPEY